MGRLLGADDDVPVEWVGSLEVGVFLAEVTRGASTSFPRFPLPSFFFSSIIWTKQNDENDETEFPMNYTRREYGRRLV